MTDTAIRLGLRENAAQFTLLIVVNAFVGGMVGMERSILPAMAEEEFGLFARSAILSFILVFGLTKAFANYAAGRLSDRFGRRHVLIAGWLVAAPVPFLLMWAPDWNWVLIANARQVILVSDATKFERTAPVRIGHLSQVDTFITDHCDIEEVRKICQDNEVELVETLR